MWFKSKKSFKVALVLGGGGARGMAHIGVLKVLEEHNIHFDMIVGTSAGALIGGMYAQLGSASEVESHFARFIASQHYEDSVLHRFSKKTEAENFFGQIASRIRERIVINLAYSRKGLFKRERMREMIDDLVAAQAIETLSIPYAAVAVDLISGQEVVFRSGDIRDAIEASSALPGYFNPIEKNGKLLVDGAVLQVVPTITARQMGADFVIAVNVSQDLPENPELDNTVDIMFRATSVLNNRYNQYLLREADVVLRPPVGKLHWADFDSYLECIEKGKKVAKKAVPLIRKKLDYRRKVLRSLFSSEPEEKVVEIAGDFS